MKDGRNRTADTVLYEKIIGDNSYYVVQAVADTKAKTLYVVTAFIGKSGYKKEATQLINANSPDATSKDGSALASNNKIPHEEASVKNKSMPKSENYSEDGPFSSGSPMQIARENLKKYENGELSREQYLEENEWLWGEAIEKYGSIPEGENAQAPIQTPKAVDEGKLTERFVRTIIETGRLTDEALENIEEKVLVGDFSYKVKTQLTNRYSTVFFIEKYIDILLNNTCTNAKKVV